MRDVLTDVVQVYASLFVHCWDSYAVQSSDGEYRRMRKPLTVEQLTQHLTGRLTLGTYLLDAADTCQFAVFDDDRPDGLQQLLALQRELAQVGVGTLLEMSRRPGHLWVHFAEPTPAYLVRAWLLPYAQRVGCEFYPKQDRRVSGGPGSLIRLPLGIHQQSGRRYPFVHPGSSGELVTLGSTVEQCCMQVAQLVQRVRVPDAVVVSYGQESVPPSVMLLPHDEPGVVPGRGAIRVWCESQDTARVISQYVRLDSRGVGSCPFKGHHYRGDLCPSFQVFAGHNAHWYCYAWRRAGNLFDFFCEYYGLTPQEGWVWLQEGRFG